MLSFEKRIVLVTGGASGISCSIAWKAAMAGGTVALADQKRTYQVRAPGIADARR